MRTCRWSGSEKHQGDWSCFPSSLGLQSLWRDEYAQGTYLGEDCLKYKTKGLQEPG